VKVRDEEMQGAVKKAFDAQDFKDVDGIGTRPVRRLPGWRLGHLTGSRDLYHCTRTVILQGEGRCGTWKHG
jgi:hypothetical protein